MSVDSYLALFTTVYGWAFYGVLWDVLRETGIVYLPLLRILFINIIEPSTSQEARDATSTSLRRMQWEFTLAFLVIVLAGQPFMALTPAYCITRLRLRLPIRRLQRRPPPHRALHTGGKAS